MTDPGSPSLPEKLFPPGVLPAGLRVYAVGDIHGRFDLLQALVARIKADLAAHPHERVIEIYVGDYVDRGLNTREVIDWMIDAPALGSQRICLMGNHEDLLLRALDGPTQMSNWIFNDGGETIASYLVRGPERPNFSNLDDLRAAFLRVFPDRHGSFLRSLPRSVAFGGYFFVHAGIRPERPLDDQDPEDLIWIREPFLKSDDDFGTVVVHGHTPVSRPQVKPNRIDIDTGAVFSGRLTCLVLEGSSRRFFDTADT